jgi:ATP-dependent Zn protease
MAEQTPHNQKPRPRRGGTPTPARGGPSIWVQLAAAFGVFLLISAGYSAVRQYLSVQNETVSLSQIAQDVDAGKISSIEVSGDDITATYADKTVKTSQKETETSLTQTLVDYGIAPTKLATVKVSIQDQSGLQILGDWTLLPIIIPLIFLFGLVWYLSRQLRRAECRRSHSANRWRAS